MHLNIQSIQPKLDLVKCESHAYDILIYSESWLKPEIKVNDILIENFLPPYRTDRVDRPGGGVVIYVRDSMSFIVELLTLSSLTRLDTTAQYSYSLNSYAQNLK